MNHREQILHSQLAHYRLLQQEAALAGNEPRTRWMAKECDRCERRIKAMERHPSTGRGGA